MSYSVTVIVRTELNVPRRAGNARRLFDGVVPTLRQARSLIARNATTWASDETIGAMALGFAALVHDEDGSTAMYAEGGRNALAAELTWYTRADLKAWLEAVDVVVPVKRRQSLAGFDPGPLSVQVTYGEGPSDGRPAVLNGVGGHQ